MLTVSINGEKMAFDNQLTVTELLADYLSRQGRHNKRVAVAVNGEFIPRSQYTQTSINSSDEIDIVTAVGGG